MKHKGLRAAALFDNHVFCCAQKKAANQARVTWEKTVHHLGTICRQDTSNELQSEKRVIIAKPERAQGVLDKRADRVIRRNISQQQERLAAATLDQKAVLQTTEAGADAEATMSLATLENKIEEATHQASTDPPTALDETEKNKRSNAWQQTCCKQTS